MISKEELEKLIKEEATIYAIDDGELLKIKTKFIHHPKKVEDGTILDNIYNVCYEKDGGIYVYEVSSHYEDLYKTKEEAEFAKRFKNITRTETLDLPTWEEFTIDREMEEFGFFNKYTRYCCIEVISKNWFRDYLVVKENGMIVYGGKFDREHYIEACRVAKDLFLGKEPKGEK